MIFAPPEPNDEDGGCAAACDDGIACTVDSCDPTTGACRNDPLDEACSDGDPCTGVETCDATRGCVAGTPPSCDDGNSCTADRCDASAPGGCVHDAPDADGDTSLDAACGGDDCDDASADVHPGAAEVCNGVDDDCASGTDDGFACIAGGSQTTPCGRCGTQSRACDASCAWSGWGACTGEGSCTADQTESRACSCDSADTESRVCSSTCQWGDWLGCRACGQVGAVFHQSDFEVQAGAVQIFGQYVVDDVWVWAALGGSEEDDTYTTTTTPCRGEAPRTVAGGWDIERKRVDDRNVRLLVRGVSDRDCGEGGQAVNAGEIRVYAPWTIVMPPVACEVTLDTLASGGREIPTWCTVDPAAGTISWQSGSVCDGCCDCAEAASVNIEVTVSRP
ncbi:MAG: putative metal-binding motif-containing protein [Deltaproteobacteria bacterium]|nr:putative metal-binding motif-containing protein [Deltaproteobacteria bacterium]